MIIHLKRGSLLCFPTAVANLRDQAKANTDVEIICRLLSPKSADPLQVLFSPDHGARLLNSTLNPNRLLEKEWGNTAPLTMPCRLIGFTETDLAPLQVVKSSSPVEKTESPDSSGNLIHNAKHRRAVLEELETTALGFTATPSTSSCERL